MSPPARPRLYVAADFPRPEELCRRIEANFAGRVAVSTAGVDAAEVEGGVVLAPLAALPRRARGVVVAVADVELHEIVEAMAARPWLDHVLPMRALDDGAAPCMGALYRLVTGESWIRLATVVGRSFHGRQASLSDSQRREARVESIAELASDEGAPASVVTRIRDVAEELLTNALYDAAAERDGVPARRCEQVRLPAQQACQLTYGRAADTFFLRVQDPFGSLRRSRLIEVLQRCQAEGGISLDASRGGAGLGMWRIFASSCMVLVQVEPGLRTEFLVGVDLRPARRAARDHAVHLFFGEAARAATPVEARS